MAKQDASELYVADFMAFFKGNIHNYGQHTYNFVEGEVKEKGKSITVTDKLLTIGKYRDHLNGKSGLGLIPINEENKCCFAVIDIDLYAKDLDMYIEAIEKNNFPLIPFKSKSGGLHLYMFFKTFVSAKTAIDLMNKLVALLSIDTLIKQESNKVVEVFPKQYKLQKGRVGSWINLPYYDCSKTRACAIKNGKDLGIEEAILYIKEKITTVGDVENFIKDLPFNDAPPCLQSLYFLNPLRENDGRNEFLFSFGVYLKKKDENFFEQALFEINNSLSNPLDPDELERTIISSLRKKDYTYKCKISPCLDYCNKTRCKKREYGVGKEDGYFSDLDYGKLYQIKTAQPYYEWEIKVQDAKGFKKLRFRNEDEIIRQDTFLKLCFRELHLLPIKLKQAEWFKIINQCLIEIEIVDIEQEDDTSPITLFKSFFFDFLLNRAMAQTQEQILNKRVFFDKEKELYYFRTKDFLEYLFVHKNFRYFTPGEIHSLLIDMKVQGTRIRLGKKQVRISTLSLQDSENVSIVDTEKFEPDFKEYDPEAF
jgi:hypothetical protein